MPNLYRLNFHFHIEWKTPQTVSDLTSSTYLLSAGALKSLYRSCKGENLPLRDAFRITLRDVWRVWYMTRSHVNKHSTLNTMNYKDQLESRRKQVDFFHTHTWVVNMSDRCLWVCSLLMFWCDSNWSRTLHNPFNQWLYKSNSRSITSVTDISEIKWRAKRKSHVSQIHQNSHMSLQFQTELRSVKSGIGSLKSLCSSVFFTSTFRRNIWWDICESSELWGVGELKVLSSVHVCQVFSVSPDIFIIIIIICFSSIHSVWLLLSFSPSSWRLVLRKQSWAEELQIETRRAVSEFIRLKLSVVLGKTADSWDLFSSQRMSSCVESKWGLCCVKQIFDLLLSGWNRADFCAEELKNKRLSGTVCTQQSRPEKLNICV